MADRSKMSDAELMVVAAMPSLVEQESGGRPGVLGPPTRYGRAEGMTQMLPKTAQGMAQKLGVPWRPELMTGKTQEAAEYQHALGQAYLQEGIETTGNMADGLRYYHGGPDRRQWGPKTQAYAGSVLQKVGYDGASDGNGGGGPPSLADMSDEELMALAGSGPEPEATPMVVDINESQHPEFLARKVAGGRELPAAAMADAKRRVGTAPDALRSITQGATLGYSDELNALTGAAETGITNFVGGLTGRRPQYGMRDAYDAIMAEEGEQNRAFRKANPKTDFGLQFGGAVVSPVARFGGGFIGGARSLAGAVGRGALVGGLSGGVAGAGYAEPGSRPQGAALGAALGGVMGGAVPVFLNAGRGAINAARKVIAPGTVDDAAMREAGEALAEAGLDIRSLSPAARSRLGDYMRRGRNPREAAWAVVATNDLPVAVPLTRGRRTGDPGQQLTENMMLRGARGSAASRHMRGVVGEQQDALRGNVDAIGDMVAGGRAPSRGEGAQAVSQRLNSLYDEASDGVNTAYAAARAADQGVALPRGQTAVLGVKLREGVRSFDLDRVPAVARELDRIDTLSNAGPPTVRDLFDARARLTSLRASNDGVEAGAARAAVRELDNYLDDALEQNLLAGDAAAVGLWREAIGKRREFGRMFESGDLLEALTERVDRGGARTMKVDPGDAANYILGRSDLGFVGKQNLHRDLERLRGVLGPESAEWNGIRAEVFQRLASSAEGGVEFGSRQFSGVKFAKAWSDLNRKDPRLAGTLFTTEERALINRFAVVSARVTSPVKGGDNNSNTAVTAMRLLGNLRFLRGLPFVSNMAQEAEVQINLNAARRATSGVIGARARPYRPPGSTGTRVVQASGQAGGRTASEPR